MSEEIGAEDAVGEMREVHLVRLVVHATTQEPLAILAEADEIRCVVVSVRPPEAEVMSHGAHPVREGPSRLTQDVVADLALALGRRLDHGAILELADGRFTSALVLDDGTRVVVRTSDVLAVATRDDLPIRVAAAILDEVGQSLAELSPPDRRGEPHEQVREMRRFLDEVSPDDFGRPS